MKINPKYIQITFVKKAVSAISAVEKWIYQQTPGHEILLYLFNDILGNIVMLDIDFHSNMAAP